MERSDTDLLDYNQCQETVRRLDAYLSGELSADDSEMVLAHLSRCRGCGAKFAFEKALLHTIRQKVEQIRAPADLRQRILALLDD